MDGERILGPDVDKALMCSNRMAADRHGLQDAVRVALDRGAVHVGARVTFVGVTDDIFHVIDRRFGEVPFHPGGESGTATSAQTGDFHLVDDIFRGHVEQHLLQRLVSVTGDIFLDILRIDETTVAKYDTELLLVELDVLATDMGALALIVQQALDLAALYQMLADQFLRIAWLDVHVERVFRQDLDNRSLGTEPETTGLDDLHAVGDTLRLALFHQCLVNLVGVAGLASAAATDQHVVS